MLEDLEAEVLEYETVGEFLVDIRKEFGGGDEESALLIPCYFLMYALWSTHRLL